MEPSKYWSRPRKTVRPKRALLALLIGCGLRRSELAALTLEHIQPRDGRWVIVDLVGKGSRVRTVPVPMPTGPRRPSTGGPPPQASPRANSCGR